jgi:hypothetical protein
MISVIWSNNSIGEDNKASYLPKSFISEWSKPGKFLAILSFYHRENDEYANIKALSSGMNYLYNLGYARHSQTIV